MIKNILIAVACFFLLAQSLNAQNLTSNASQFLSRLSPTEGLSQSYVIKTIQDTNGYIWIATEMGLNRFDGYNVIQIEGPDKVFAKDRISTLFIDEQGFMWVGTSYSGLFRLDTSTLLSEQFITGKITPTSKSYSEVNVIIQAKNNGLWLGVSESVYLLDVATKKLTPYLKLNTKDDLIRDMYLENNDLYCATSDGLYQVNILSKNYEILPHKPASVMSRDSKNTKRLIKDPVLGLMVGTVDGLYQLNSTSVESRSNKTTAKVLIPHLNIWDMLKYQDGYLVATDKGVFQFDPKNLTLYFMLKFSDSAFQTTDNNVLDLFEDASGNIWLASKSQGVMIWSPLTARFQHITSTTSPKLSNDNIWALHQDKNKQLWVGTDNGINRVDLTNNENTVFLKSSDPKSAVGKQFIRNIFANPEDDNLLWITNDDGLFSFNKTTGQLSPPYFNDRTQRLIGNKWLSGLFVLDNEHIALFNEQGHYLYNSVNGQTRELIALDDLLDVDLSYSFLGFVPGDKNKVFLATSGHLYTYDLLNHKISLIYKVNNYQPQTFDYVDSWVLDKNNILWLAMTGEGLIGIDYNTLKVKYRYDSSNKLTNNNIYSLQLDRYDNLWFSSQVGLFRLNLETQHIENFIASDGLISNEFNGYAFTELHDERLAYGSPLGVTLFSPKEFVDDKAKTPSYQVTLTSLSLMSDKSRLFSPSENFDEITLAHNDYGLKVQFSTLQFIRQARTKYRITLLGPQPFYYENYNKNELILPKLSPGNYELVITAIDPFTGDFSKPLLIKVRTLYAPWLSPLAKFLYLFLFILICGSYIYSRNKQRRELQLAYNRTNASKDQMQLALKGSNSGIWDYKIIEDQLYEDRLGTTLGYRNLQLPITIKKHQSFMDEQSSRVYKQVWCDFIKGYTDYWDYSYQMQSVTGDWYWYRDIGQITARDDDGRPTRVSGTYTNITKTKASEDKASLFGKVFSQINDWVLILDANRVAVSANAAFSCAFSVESSALELNFKDFLRKLGKVKFKMFHEILDQIQPGNSWQGEEVIETSKKSLHPVLIKINAIANDNKNISHYVIVVSDITRQKQAEEKLRHLAHYDYLTNLPNRKLIYEELEHVIKVQKSQFALFFIDLDKFKTINDSLGHAAGDELLKIVAQILIKNVKAHDLVARQSGDEFMILVSSYENIDVLSHIAERINSCLSEPISLNDNQISISSSIGIALFPEDATSANEIVKKADLAMMHAKNSGNGQFQFFTQEMNIIAHQRLTLEAELKQACKDKALVNYYQPIVNSAQNSISGFELLLRWPHVDGMISPGVFIPIAEETGIIIQLTETAIEQALKDYLRWQSTFPGTYISINLSAIHILQDGLCKLLLELLDKYQLPPDVLRLEITEGTLLVDLNVALSRLQELKKFGFKLLLDDFGTGYSSLTYLSQFPIDVLKIDKSFVLNFDTNPMNKPIIKSIIALAQNLNLTCIAEGVETEEQLHYIHHLGCEAIQGFYFAKPMPVDALIAFKLSNTKKTLMGA